MPEVELTGRHQKGDGKAHEFVANHDGVFDCRMVGTFNIRLDGSLLDWPATRDYDGERYWLLRLEAGGLTRYGWAYRWPRSNMNRHIAEVLTKHPLSQPFMENEIRITLPLRWQDDYVHKWAARRYWFQTFPWTEHVRKSDSARVWKAINTIQWPGLTVLDYGCHTGFFCFRASLSGADVVGYDISTGTIEAARQINDHIEQQDCVFTDTLPTEQFDVILYLSVHHQRDSTYDWLEAEIERLKRQARKHLFVELHVVPDHSTPPVVPKMPEGEIDRIVGGRILDRYQHRLRGTRKIYQVDL